MTTTTTKNIEQKSFLLHADLRPKKNKENSLNEIKTIISKEFRERKGKLDLITMQSVINDELSKISLNLSNLYSGFYQEGETPHDIGRLHDKKENLIYIKSLINEKDIKVM